MPGVLVLLMLAAAASVPWIAELGGSFKTNPKGAVTEANFRTTWIDDADLSRLAALSDLRSIDLSHTRITDLGFRSLKPLAHVETLDLYYAEQIGDGALNVLRGWKSLRRLNLRGTKVTDAGIALLAEHPSLESLDVGFSLFTDGGFEALTTMPKLRELAVGGNKVTDAGLNYLRLIPGLKSLDLSGTQRTDSGPWTATVTDRSLETIGTLRGLEGLNLRSAKLSSAGAAQLGALAALRTLDVSETQITSADLAALLSKLTGLTRLAVHGCGRVDDAAATALAGARSLTWLDIGGTKMSEAAVARLRESNPQLRVVWQKP